MTRTFIEPEERAYPNGRQARRCLAIYPDGKVRVAWAGIPDTFWTISAHGRIGGKYVAGFVSVAGNFTVNPDGTVTDNPHAGELTFTPYKRGDE